MTKRHPLDTDCAARRVKRVKPSNCVGFMAVISSVDSAALHQMLLAGYHADLWRVVRTCLSLRAGVIC